MHMETTTATSEAVSGAALDTDGTILMMSGRRRELDDDDELSKVIVLSVPVDVVSGGAGSTTTVGADGIDSDSGGNTIMVLLPRHVPTTAAVSPRTALISSRES